MTRPSFELSKWYFDCVTQDGRAFIGYAGELRWKSLALHYQSSLLHSDRDGTRTRFSLRKVRPPSVSSRHLTGNRRRCKSRERGTHWNIQFAPPFCSRTPAQSSGTACSLAPRPAFASQRLPPCGLGYAEHLRITIPPWRFPLQELRWGRFLSEAHSLIWIDWQGSYSTRVVFHNGASVQAESITEQHVVLTGRKIILDFERSSVLREGTLAETALSKIPNVRKIFPRSVLGIRECKWKAARCCAAVAQRMQAAGPFTRWSNGREPALVHQQSALRRFFCTGFARIACPVGQSDLADVDVPLRASLPLGIALSVAGGLLVVLGMAALWIHGQGLPMNLAPPPRYVTQGIFRLLPHPIYTGFCLLCVGVSIAAGSASALWLISPIVILGCAALVLGYERHDLRERFGDAQVTPHAILPADERRPPLAVEIVRCYLCVLIPWVFLYEAVVSAGVPHDAMSAYLSFENHLPVWEWTELIYASCYIVIALAPLIAADARDLRRFAVRGLLAMAIVFPLYLVIPLIALPRPFVPQGMLGEMLNWERAWTRPARPSRRSMSFGRCWRRRFSQGGCLRCAGFGGDGRCWWRRCITTGMHALVDVLSGFAVVALVAHAAGAWRAVRDWAERLCNSWQDWRLGPLRVINHGVYAGLAGFAGVFITQTLAGPQNASAIFVAVMAGLIGAGLWAQFVEGSPVLLRPFGYYGGLLGTILGVLAAPLLGCSIWLLLAAFGVSGPWVQALGRLRCLVQGCCHGRPAPESVGIRYLHPQSRVTRLTSWQGLPIHATPLYSILWNIVTGVALARLWMLHAPLHLIAGLYLILNGLGRFVEEAYRGEPQTPVFARLRVYQWMAIGTVVAGALLTAIGRGRQLPRRNSASLLSFPLSCLACCATSRSAWTSPTLTAVSPGWCEDQRPHEKSHALSSLFQQVAHRIYFEMN